MAGSRPSRTSARSLKSCPDATGSATLASWTTNTWTRSRMCARSAITCRSRSLPSTTRTGSSFRAGPCCASKTSPAPVEASRPRGVRAIPVRGDAPKGEVTTPMPEGDEGPKGQESYFELAELAGSFIHEIKNHLSTLGLNLQLLTEDFQEPESQRERRALERIQRLQDECQRLVDVSNDFLRFAHVKDLELLATDLGTVGEGMGGFFAPTAPHSKIVIQPYLPSDF